MNAIEMQHSFVSKALVLVGQRALDIDTYKIQNFLNEAQVVFIDRYVDLLEKSEEAKVKLQPMYKHYSTTATAAGSDGFTSTSLFAVTPTDFRKAMSEYVAESVGGTNIKIMPIAYDEYLIEKDNPFKQPSTDLAWRLVHYSTGNKFELVIDSVTFAKVGQTYTYKLRYIAMPATIDIFNNTSCTLNASDHYEIVNIALRLAFGGSGQTEPTNE